MGLTNERIIERIAGLFLKDITSNWLHFMCILDLNEFKYMYDNWPAYVLSYKNIIFDRQHAATFPDWIRWANDTRKTLNLPEYERTN